MKLGKLSKGWLTAGLAVLAFIHRADATVSMTLTDPSSLSDNVNGEYIGLYQFTVGGVTSGDPSHLSAGDVFNSVCLSPIGVLDSNPHTYDYTSFANAAPGLNGPFPWATGVQGDAGIQNVNYLWKTFGSTISSGDAGAGLAEAMYTALYNSTGYAALGAGPYSASGLNAATTADMTGYLNALIAAGALGVSNDRANGYILVPDPAADGSGQEFIILAPPGNNLIPIPEPSNYSVVTAAFLLVGVAGSVVRRNKSPTA